MKDTCVCGHSRYNHFKMDSSPESGVPCEFTRLSECHCREYMKAPSATICMCGDAELAHKEGSGAFRRCYTCSCLGFIPNMPPITTPMSLPKKYRLLKELPGLPLGTELVKTENGYVAIGVPIVCGALASPYTEPLAWATVMYNPEWFEEVKEPQKPRYPADIRPEAPEIFVACGQFNALSAKDCEKAEDAFEKLVKALSAKFNREGWKPKNGDPVYFLKIEDQSYVSGHKVEVGSHAYHDLPELDDGDLGDFTAGVYWPTKEVAQAVCDHINIFFTQ